MPPPYSNQEYLNRGPTSVTQFVVGNRRVVILTAARQGLKGKHGVLTWVGEAHEGWRVVPADTTKAIGGEKMVDAGEEGEGEVNQAAALHISTELMKEGGEGDVVYVINCARGQVRSVTIAAHLRARFLGESPRAAYDSMTFDGGEQTEGVKRRVLAGL